MENRPKRNFLYIAHRGVKGTEPENTLRSFQKAVDLGASWIELDVHYVHNTLLVIHDDEYRLPGCGRVKLCDMPMETIRQIKIEFNQKTDNIPTLNEVLDRVDKKANINVELKGRGTAKPVCELIRKYVTDHGWEYRHFLVSSFHFDELVEVFNENKNIPLAYLINRNKDDLFDRMASIHAKYVNISRYLYASEGAGIIRKAHAADIGVLVYTVNEKKSISSMKRHGVNGVFTDFIGRCLSCRKLDRSSTGC